MNDQLKKTDELARNILTMSRNTLLVNLRFLDMALSMFHFTPYQGTIGTNGKNLYYNPIHVLKSFKDEREYSTREYLHMVFHCVFQHMFVGPAIDRRLWNLACDIAVENAISELSIKSTVVKKETDESYEISTIGKKSNSLTAEKLYRYLLDANLSEFYLCKLEELFLYDDHSVWYDQDDEESGGNSNESGEDEQQSGNSSSNNGSTENNESTAQLEGNSSQTTLSSTSPSSLSQEWKDISERMQQDLETFSKQQGDTAGNVMQNLREVNREKYDYTAFLKKFAVHTEVMKINDDEFDYIFYTYGLSLYKKMPLIEPLEYKDAKHIREFVIAIDTSGSTSGELVQKFVQKTYNVLKSTETFASKINLHIIQCDADIQEDVKITTQDEFDEYLKNMTIKGLGGTDFRPVFEYVSNLQQNHEFTNLKGLVYFTDGYGIFPSKKPYYNTAFVFIDDEYSNPNVPSWAIKLTLKSEEI